MLKVSALELSGPYWNPSCKKLGEWQKEDSKYYQFHSVILEIKTDNLDSSLEWYLVLW